MAIGVYELKGEAWARLAIFLNHAEYAKSEFSRRTDVVIRTGSFGNLREQIFREANSSDPLAVFVHANGIVERRSSHWPPKKLPLIEKFFLHDERMRDIPRHEKDIVQGPPIIVTRNSIPIDEFRQLVAERAVLIIR